MELKLSRILFIASLLLGIPVRSMAAIPGSERGGLVELYDSAGGVSWTRNTNWLGPAGTECTWYGVFCNVDQTHVVTISLADNHLIGNLPSGIGLLTQLEGLFLNNNQLSGSIPAGLMGIATLRYVALQNNLLSGTIPPLTGLGMLQTFDLTSNNLTGSIPALTGLSSLLAVYFSNNQLTGPLPALDGLSQLQIIYAYNNHLSGMIPALTGLSALTTLHVERNALHGLLPDLPVPNHLIAGNSSVCPNPLDQVSNPPWDTVTGSVPWYGPCDPIFSNGFQ